jgi:DNA-binding transcriptional MerR regulator
LHPDKHIAEAATDETPAEGEQAGPRLLKVGQLAELSGKTVRAMHLYEELGLLRPALRSKGGFRLYSESAVQRVEWISRLQEADVSLSEIQDFLRDMEDAREGSEAMARVRQLFEHRLEEIRKQRMKLQQLEADIEAGLRYLDGCKTCEPEHLASECGECRIHGHDGTKPLMVAGLHHG